MDGKICPVRGIIFYHLCKIYYLEVLYEIIGSKTSLLANSANA
jgi:hypothetical protein